MQSSNTHYLLVYWGEECNGSRFTLHFTDSMSDVEIFDAIDEVGDPSDAQYVEIKESDLPPLSDESVEILDLAGYMDAPTHEKHFEDVWVRRYKQAAYVYLMKDLANNLYKIGKSVNPMLRERTLQSQKPTIDKVFHAMERPDFNESILHKRYADQRVRGEWFELSDAQVRFICVTGKLTVA